MQALDERAAQERVLGLWGFGALGLWGFGALGLWGFGALGLWGFGALGLWGFGALGLWGFGALGFGGLGGLGGLGFRVRKCAVAAHVESQQTQSRSKDEDVLHVFGSSAGH